MQLILALDLITLSYLSQLFRLIKITVETITNMSYQEVIFMAFYNINLIIK